MPRIRDRGIIPAILRIRLDPAPEGTVKGNNGAVLHRKERCLNSHQDHLTGDNEEDGADDGGENDGGTLVVEDGIASSHVQAKAVGVVWHEEGERRPINVHTRSDHGRKQPGKLYCSPVKHRWQPGCPKGTLKGGYAALERPVGLLSDDEVQPHCRELDQQKGKEQSSDHVKFISQKSGVISDVKRRRNRLQ